MTDEATFNKKFLRMFHGQGRFFQKEPLAAGGKKSCVMYNQNRHIKLKLYKFSLLFSTQIYNLWCIDRNDTLQYHLILPYLKLKIGGIA
jgi:hypothetical protein